jgi:uncharacterized protein
MDDALLPISTHIFEFDEQYYVFDVRNFSILKVTTSGASVLHRMNRCSLQSIVQDMSSQVSADVVRAHYLRFLELIRDGTLSVEPISAPSHVPFHRLVIMLAGGCNMGCSYCFEKNVPDHQNYNCMTYEKATQAIDWFLGQHQGRKSHVQLYGGEPLLNWKVLERVVERLEKWAQSQRIDHTTYLITNGTLLSPSRISFLKSHNVTVQVSVDGDAAAHDRFRKFKSGRPTMSHIERNVRELARQGIDFNLRAVLTHQNIDPIRVLAALKDLGGQRVSFDLVASDEESVRLTPMDWIEFNNRYRQLLFSGQQKWSDLPEDMKSMIRRIVKRQPVFFGCGGGVSEVTVAPDGTIYDCQRLFREPIGSISHGILPRALPARMVRSVDDKKRCKECWARYLCGGGCLHQAVTEHGSNEPSDQYCVRMHNLVEASIVKIDAIRRLANHSSGVPDLPQDLRCIADR